MRARIAGTGSYVPAKVLTNADLEQLVATSDAWIVERTGIRERHVAGPGEACSDLAVKAAERALTAAGVSAADLDMILLATCTGDYPIPATACLIQHQLGATRAAACDLSAACCGFGDGAGAAVISASENDSGILSTHLRSDGALCDLIAVPGGGSRLPPSEKVVAERMQYIRMKGNETFKAAVRTLEEVARETLAASHLRVEDLDLYVPHQANVRILKAVAERLGLPPEKVMLNLDRYGNTSAASIPIALDEAVGQGRIKEGGLVMLGAFGAGLTWASALIRW